MIGVGVMDDVASLASVDDAGGVTGEATPATGWQINTC